MKYSINASSLRQQKKNLPSMVPIAMCRILQCENSPENRAFLGDQNSILKYTQPRPIDKQTQPVLLRDHYYSKPNCSRNYVRLGAVLVITFGFVGECS